MQTNKIKSQKEKIKEWLEDGLSLTRVTAYEQGFGLNLPARINELKNEGLKIDNRPAYDGSREKEYFLRVTNAN